MSDNDLATPPPLPTWEECRHAVEAGGATHLQTFIYQNEPADIGPGFQPTKEFRLQLALMLTEVRRLAVETSAPIPMILHCPKCHAIHEDAPNPARGWTNPPHRSHECQTCGCIWRPADVPTTGVLYLGTKGRVDTVDNTSLSSKENCEHGFRKGRCTFCVPSSPVEPSEPPVHSLTALFSGCLCAWCEKERARLAVKAATHQITQARFCDYKGELVERDGKMVCPQCGNS